MSYLHLQLYPPQNWQDFEIMMKGVAEIIWDQRSWHHYGRGGQAQSGIDLYGYDQHNRCIGIQCKRKTKTNPSGQLLDYSLLTEYELDAEARSAKNIVDPVLYELIFATTASSDTKIQDGLRRVRKKFENDFLVDIWFWEDIAAHIQRHKILLNWYFRDVLVNLSLYDQDQHILETLRNAFSRPAFHTNIRSEESGGDFLQAIKDTQEVINTGKYYNRRKDLIATIDPANCLSNASWRNSMNDISKNLQQIRTLYQSGVKSGKIIQHPVWIDVQDEVLTIQLNFLRSDSLFLLNKILHEKGGIEPIVCDLVQYHSELKELFRTIA